MSDGFTAAELSLSSACPDLGSDSCLACELGDDKPLDDCDYACIRCFYQQCCPCSKEGWNGRQVDVH